MKRTLLLMRHAKSDLPTISVSDFDRPLNIRGNADALLIGQWITDHDCIPDKILCSSAVRAQQTVHHICQNTKGASRTVEINTDLYHADLNQLLKMLKGSEDATSQLLMIGHNPGFSDLLRYLCSGAKYPTVEQSMTTAALAVIQFNIPWAMFCEGAGHLVSMVQPRNLQNAAT